MVFPYIHSTEIRQRWAFFSSLIAISILIGGCYLRSERRRSAERAVARLGGTVQHDMGVCTCVGFENTEVTDEDLWCLHVLRPEFGVYLKGANVTDGAVSSFAGLTPWVIDLRETGVTRIGVEKLRELTSSPHGCHIVTDWSDR